MVEMELVAECDGYELVKDIGWGSFGVAKLMRDRITMELVAVKFIERGDKIDQNVRREVINHRSLRHPNIIRFKEVALTPTHLAIIMEYASGGELFARILDAGRVGEDEARYFFQQLISGVSYFHSMEVCHRDLKLENMLLDGSTAPQLKICDFGYSKSSVLDSQPNSTVGTPSYLAPEVISAKEYDGKCADVWSCGVTLYIMLVGTYPFGDPENITKTILRILGIQYSFPDSLHISPECKDLISRIFVEKPAMRITIPEIQNHTWFLKNLPVDLMKDNSTNNLYEELDLPMQNLGKIIQIITEATLPSFLTQSTLSPMDSMDDEEVDADLELVADSSGEVVHAM